MNFKALHIDVIFISGPQQFIKDTINSQCWCNKMCSKTNIYIYIYRSKRSLGREKDASNLSFKISKSFPLTKPSLQNFFPTTSLAIDIAKLIKEKEETWKGKKVEKQENYITLCEDARCN